MRTKIVLTIPVPHGVANDGSQEFYDALLDHVNDRFYVDGSEIVTY